MAKQVGGSPNGRPHGQAGGKHRKSHRKSHRKHSSVKRGGEGVIATAAVPFGLLALQRFFKGSKTSKRGVRNIGSTFKRTFRRRRH